VYIDPGLISIYDTDYLVLALRKPIPLWLKKLITQELQKRGVAFSPSSPSGARPAADIIAVPFKIEEASEFNICYNSIEAIITLSNRCPEY